MSKKRKKQRSKDSQKHKKKTTVHSNPSAQQFFLKLAIELMPLAVQQLMPQSPNFEIINCASTIFFI